MSNYEIFSFALQTFLFSFGKQQNDNSEINFPWSLLNWAVKLFSLITVDCTVTLCNHNFVIALISFVFQSYYSPFAIWGPGCEVTSPLLWEIVSGVTAPDSDDWHGQPCERHLRWSTILHSAERTGNWICLLPSTRAPIRYNLIRQNNKKTDFAIARSISTTAKHGAAEESQESSAANEWETFTFYLFDLFRTFMPLLKLFAVRIIWNCLLLTNKYLINETCLRKIPVVQRRGELQNSHDNILIDPNKLLTFRSSLYVTPNVAQRFFYWPLLIWFAFYCWKLFR